MVWKKIRSRKGLERHENNNNSKRDQQQPVNLKSCLKCHEDQLTQSSDFSGQPSVDAMEQALRRSSSHCRSSGGRSNSGSGESSCSVSDRSTRGASLSSGSSHPDHVDQTSSQTDTDRSTPSSRRSGAYTKKEVCFSDIHIRSFERVVGDNPSCSAGPPVGIGWAHSETLVIDIKSYEACRAYRKSQIDMVLTRREREKILYYWGAEPHHIAEGTRQSLKAKNQRRQTLRNLGKAERIEEGLENVTRTLKRTLLRKKRTSDKVKELQERAQLAARNSFPVKYRTTASATQGPYEHQSYQSEAQRVQAVLGKEPEKDYLDSLEFHVSVSGFCRNAPAETRISSGNTVDSGDAGEDFDDGATAMSGITLGNSTTASMLEMERFYKELELEMFGEDLPSFVGQTLEVPGVEIPPEERVYDVPVVASVAPVNDARSLASSLPSIPEAEESGSKSDISNQADDQELTPIAVSIPVGPQYSVHHHNGAPPLHHVGYPVIQRQFSYPANADQGHYHQGSQPMWTRFMDLEEQEYRNIQRPVYSHPAPHRDNSPSSPHHGDSFHMQGGSHQSTMHYQYSGSKVTSSYHNGDQWCSTPRTTMMTNEHRVSPSNLAPIPLAAFDLQTSHSPTSQTSRDYNRYHGQHHYDQQKRRHNHDDGPRIRHMPLSSHLSPSGLMGDHDHEPRIRSTFVPVTITEQSNERRGREDPYNTMMHQTSYESYRPQQIPAGFY